MDRQQRCLIFTNLPYELEEYILSFWKKDIMIRKQYISLSSDMELITELYKRNNKLLYSASYPHSWTNQFKKSLKIIHNNDIPSLPWSPNIVKLNETINICLLLNECNKDTIIGMQYLNIHDIINLLTDYIRKYNAFDHYDAALKRYWVNIDDKNKYIILNNIFDKIKYDYIKYTSIINETISNAIILDMCYTQLRLWFINTPKV